MDWVPMILQGEQNFNFFALALNVNPLFLAYVVYLCILLQSQTGFSQTRNVLTQILNHLKNDLK